MATFITSKAVGEDVTIHQITTSTGYWKAIHDGTTYGPYQHNSYLSITITNANGEFTLQSCDSSGTVSGDITQLRLTGNQLTSFDGTGLSGLTQLYLYNNQLISFDGTGLSGLTELDLHNNQLTSIDVNGLSSLTYLDLGDNQLTSFDGTGLSGLTNLNLYNNQLTSFDGTGLSGLTGLDLQNNQLTSFDGTGLSGLVNLLLFGNQLTSFNGAGLSGLTTLGLSNNQFTSFDGTGLSSLTQLDLGNNQFTSFDGTGLSSLTNLALYGNQLTSFDGTGLSGLTNLELSNNQLTTLTNVDFTNIVFFYIQGNPICTPTFNNDILSSLSSNAVDGGEFYSTNGRTSVGTADYDALIARNWYMEGLDLVSGPTFITSKAVGEDVSIYAETTTRYWKAIHDGTTYGPFELNYDYQSITITNANGEFVLQSCDSTGTVSGDITILWLNGNQLTSFDGTGLSGLTELDLGGNQFTSFDGAGLSGLPYLELGNNQLTSFDGTGLSSLTYLGLAANQLTSFDGTDLSGLTRLDLYNNQLTSFDGTGLSGLTFLSLWNNQLTSLTNVNFTNIANFSIQGNPICTPTFNNGILSSLSSNAVDGGEFVSTNGRTSAGTADYDALIARGWNLNGLDLVIPPTFITSKAVGESVGISNITTTTGYWQAIHDGTTYGPFDQNDGSQTIGITNENGEFTIQSCDSSGTISGDITNLGLAANQLTSFDGTGLSGLTELSLPSNQLTSFDGTGLSGLNVLDLHNNQFISFDGTGLSSLTFLYLASNQLTSFDGTGLSSLNVLDLTNNQFISFDGTGLSSLTHLFLPSNQLTSLDVSPMVNIAVLRLFEEVKGSILTNPITSTANNQILSQLVQHSVDNGEFDSTNGRTSAGTADYDALIARGWNLNGLDLVTPPPSGSGKLRIKGVNSGGGTTTTTTTIAPTTTTTTTLSPIITDVSYTMTTYPGRRGRPDYNVYIFTPTLINETLFNISDILGTRGGHINIDPFSIRMFLVDDAGNIASDVYPHGSMINSYMTNNGYYDPSGSQELYADSRFDTGNRRVAIGYRILTSTDPVTTIDTYEDFIIDIFPTAFNIV